MLFQISKPTEPYLISDFGGEALGHTYAVTNRYLTRDGKPYLYRMGELHFSRVPREDWESELKKMRDGGIEIVSSYLFWIHHEESEGIFDFTDNRDLRFFCEICKKVNMPFFLRLGPWAHGEARNGGFPDWLLEKCGGKECTRTDLQPYLSYVHRYFSRVYEEIKDCMDVVIGIQVENELQRNATHMESLLKMIREIGFSAPIWTATGWGPGGSGANLPKRGLLPVYGGYPEAPWAAHTEPILGNDTFHFSTDWNSANIGTDIFEDCSSELETNCLEQRNPYLTCEIGGGNQVTYHRRPLVSATDVAAGVICRLGSGCNGIGYYMYHGGRNPIGHTTMQESRKTGYKNDYPIISYDFQAPIGDCGQLKESYYTLRSIHSFLESFGDSLAAMPSFLPMERPKDLMDTKTLRCAVRSDGIRGFLFVNNHTHADSMQEIKSVVHIELADGNEPVTIKLSVEAGAYGVIPFRFPIGSETVEWITAMPVFQSENEIVFEPLKGILPQICLPDGTVMPFAHQMQIGGVSICLRETKMKSDEKATPISIKKSSKKLSDEVFSHLENRDGSMLETAETTDYEFLIPAGTDFIAIEAQGNAGALFYNGALISDFFFYGERWVADVRAIPPGSLLTLKILPMTEENRSKIYFEIEMPIGQKEPLVYALSSPKE